MYPQSTLAPLPFAQAVAVFDLLTCEPEPLGLDCAAFDPRLGLPARFMPLPELRTWLAAGGDRKLAGRAVWDRIVALARGGAPQWRVAAVVLAMPVLARRAADLAAAGSRDAQTDAIAAFLADIDADVAVTCGWPGR